MEVEALLKEEGIMILGVQETWLKSTSPQIRIPGYDWFGVNKDVKGSVRGEGGVGFLVHSSLVEGVKFSSHFSDSRVVSLTFNRNAVINIYNFTSQHLEEQCELLENVSELINTVFSGYCITILGDFKDLDKMPKPNLNA